MRAVCRDINIKHQKRVFEADRACESVAGKEVCAGINKWKQPTLFEQRQMKHLYPWWFGCWQRSFVCQSLDFRHCLIIFSQNMYQRPKSVFYFFPCSAGRQWFVFRHITLFHYTWSVIGPERWNSLCGTATLGGFTYQFVSWLSKSDQSCRNSNICAACSYFLKIKYKHEQ